jgi:hypothetical protein
MNTLEKLAEKNRTHKKHLRAERVSALIFFIGLLPAYIDWGYSLTFSTLEFPKNLFYIVASCVGALCFSLPLMAMGDLMIFPKWFKIVVFLFLQAWFTYFWVFHNLSWPAFLVLIPVYIFLQFQMPAIKRKIEAEENGL